MTRDSSVSADSGFNMIDRSAALIFMRGSSCFYCPQRCIPYTSFGNQLPLRTHLRSQTKGKRSAGRCLCHTRRKGRSYNVSISSSSGFQKERRRTATRHKGINGCIYIDGRPRYSSASPVTFLLLPRRRRFSIGSRHVLHYHLSLPHTHCSDTASPHERRRAKFPQAGKRAWCSI
ncbi:hypothetical protein BC826DRAFT_347180 [Russula brevipes]|nr:hypothetical protein BC826DRAFT_347180 [Russula brevipes]